MILQKLINSFSKTYDFIKMINLFNKADDFRNSEKIKAFPLVCSKYLSSFTGPDMTEVRDLVQFGTFQVQKWYFDEIT